MSSRSELLLAAVIAFLASSFSAQAQDWERFAATSGQGDDAAILRLMEGASLEESLSICRGLGRRPELEVQPVIDFLANRQRGDSMVQPELLLRQLLASVLKAHPSLQELRAWTAANASALDLLLSPISRWDSPELKAILVQLAAVADRPESRTALMEAGEAVVGRLRETGGVLPPDEGVVAGAFLRAARTTGSADFLSTCASIAGLSRDPALVEQARATSRELSAAPAF